MIISVVENTATGYSLLSVLCSYVFIIRIIAFICSYEFAIQPKIIVVSSVCCYNDTYLSPNLSPF